MRAPAIQPATTQATTAKDLPGCRVRDNTLTPDGGCVNNLPVATAPDGPRP